MTPYRCTDEDFIQFLIATPRTASCTEATRVQPPPSRSPAMAHDSFNRLLRRLEPEPEVLWQEARSQVDLKRGVLILDDSTLDKPYARKMDLVSWHWSGKHQKVVKGINLLTLLWSDGDRRVPCEYRIVDKQKTEPADSLAEAEHQKTKTKNVLFLELLQKAKQRGFEPQMVLFDSWYSGLKNLKTIRKMGWTFLTRLRSNRLVTPERKGLKAVSKCEISAAGTVVHLKGFGRVKVFRIDRKKAGTKQETVAEYWCTNQLETTEQERLMYSEWCWQIEQYHREIKQFCLVEKCQCRTGRLIRNYIQLALRAFLRLEQWSDQTGRSLFELTTDIVRDAVKNYLRKPEYPLQRDVSDLHTLA